MSRPSSVASLHNNDFYSTEESSSQNGSTRPRARTDASSSALSSSTMSSTSTLTLNTDHEDSSHSPKNLKKLTAAIRANINNNVARVNRPLSTSNDLLLTNPGSNQHGQHGSSPPIASGKKRWKRQSRENRITTKLKISWLIWKSQHRYSVLNVPAPFLICFNRRLSMT